MTRILVLGILLTSSIALAEKGFEDNKSRWIQHLSQKISNLESAKSCAQSASDKAALKNCRMNLKASMKSLKDQRKSHKMQCPKYQEY